jgi:hypothetical protein
MAVLVVLGGIVRSLVYLLVFVIVGVASALSTAQHALMYANAKASLAMQLGYSGVFYHLFGMVPLPIGINPPAWLSLICAAPLLLLALRRLAILARTGTFVPGEFRGFAYGLALLGFATALVALGLYLAMKSLLITLNVVAPAAWMLQGAFVLAELRQPLGATPARRRASVAAGVLLLAFMFLPWDRLLEQYAYEKFCAARSGEKINGTARAESYLVLGEGRGEDNFRLSHAVGDVLERRVRFVEVQKASSRNSLVDYIGPSSKGEFFRIAIAADAALCLPEDRQPVRLARARGNLKEGECLQVAAIEKATSRYSVDAFTDAKPAWYTGRVFATGVRIVDLQSGALLAESTVFSRVSGRPERDGRECPPMRRPSSLPQFHRKVLLSN